MYPFLIQVSMHELTHLTSDRLKLLTHVLKTFVVLLVPCCLGRLCTGDFWGGVNAAAGPITGIFLLKDEGPFFACLYEKLSTIWLVQECCGLERGVPFEYALFIFTIIVGLCALSDAFTWCSSSAGSSRLGRLASQVLAGSAACEAIAAYVGARIVIELQTLRQAEAAQSHRSRDQHHYGTGSRASSRLRRESTARLEHVGRSSRRTKTEPAVHSAHQDWRPHPPSRSSTLQPSSDAMPSQQARGWWAVLFNRGGSGIASAQGEAPSTLMRQHHRYRPHRHNQENSNSSARVALAAAEAESDQRASNDVVIGDTLNQRDNAADIGDSSSCPQDRHRIGRFRTWMTGPSAAAHEGAGPRQHRPQPRSFVLG